VIFVWHFRVNIAPETGKTVQWLTIMCNSDHNPGAVQFQFSYRQPRAYLEGRDTGFANFQPTEETFQRYRDCFAVHDTVCPLVTILARKARD